VCMSVRTMGSDWEALKRFNFHPATGILYTIIGILLIVIPLAPIHSWECLSYGDLIDTCDKNHSQLIEYDEYHSQLIEYDLGTCLSDCFLGTCTTSFCSNYGSAEDSAVMIVLMVSAIPFFVLAGYGLYRSLTRDSALAGAAAPINGYL